MLRLNKTKLTRLLIIALIGWSAVGGEIAPAVAEPPAMQHALASEAARSQLKQLKHSIARMTSLDPGRIEIKTTNAVVVVRLVNTLYNAGPASDRDHLASTIAALIEKDSKNDPRLARVIALHVQFVKRGAWFTRTVDATEFRRDQTGALVHHRT